MTERCLEHIKSDLATIQQAAGLELPFGWEDVRLNAIVGGGGVLALIWTLVPHGWPDHWGLIPLLIVTFAYVARLRMKYRRSSGRSPLRRREYTISFVLAGLLGGLVLIYRLWGGWLGIPFLYLKASAVFFVGVAFLVPAVTDRSRFYLTGLAVPIMLCGLTIPLVSLSNIAVFGAMLAVGGLAMAAIQSWQLKRRVTGHAAH